MKEETKKKIKKIAKVSGFIITFGFAVFGVLCAAVLMANASGAKDNIKTLDNSLVQNGVRSERISKPRKAPDYLNSPDLLDNARVFNQFYVYSGEDNKLSLAIYPQYRTYLLEVKKGYYYLDIKNSAGAVLYSGLNANYVSTLVSWYQENQDVSGAMLTVNDTNGNYGFKAWGGDSNSFYFYNEKDRYIAISAYPEVSLYAVDTLEVPAQDVVSLPAKWSPLGMFGGSISEDGNILTNTEWVTGYEERITLKGFLFRNQGVVYNRLRIILYWLGGTGSGNTEIGYVDANGDFHVGLSSQWCIRSIEYAFNTTNDVNNNVDDLYRFTAGQTRIDFTNTRVSVYPGIVWQNEGANVIEVIDKTYRSNGTRYTYGGLYIGSNLTDYEFLIKYNNIVALEVMGDTSLVFALMSSAFGSVTPLLSIAILPNITLGMLLFFPLVGAIIVIIIKVIKK